MFRCPRCDGALTTTQFSCEGCGFVARQERWLDFEPEDHIETYFDEVEFRYRFGAEPRHFWHRARRDVLLTLIAREVAPGASFLEVGAGCGFLSSALERAGYETWAADLSETALDYCAQNGLTRLCRVSLMNLPFEDAFDAVGSFDVVEHIEDHRRCLENLARAVKPGGVVFVTVPAFQHLWGSWDRRQRHVRRFQPDELAALIEGVGLQLTHLRPLFAALYPASLLAAVWDRALGGSSRPDRGIEQHHAMWAPPLISTVAYGLLAAERHVVTRQGPWLGTSLVAVARRP